MFCLQQQELTPANITSDPGPPRIICKARSNGEPSSNKSIFGLLVLLLACLGAVVAQPVNANASIDTQLEQYANAHGVSVQSLLDDLKIHTLDEVNIADFHILKRDYLDLRSPR